MVFFYSNPPPHLGLPPLLTAHTLIAVNSMDTFEREASAVFEAEVGKTVAALVANVVYATKLSFKRREEEINIMEKGNREEAVRLEEKTKLLEAMEEDLKQRMATAEMREMELTRREAALEKAKLEVVEMIEAQKKTEEAQKEFCEAAALVADALRGRQAHPNVDSGST